MEKERNKVEILKFVDSSKGLSGFRDLVRKDPKNWSRRQKDLFMKLLWNIEVKPQDAAVILNKIKMPRYKVSANPTWSPTDVSSYRSLNFRENSRRPRETEVVRGQNILLDFIAQGWSPANTLVKKAQLEMDFTKLQPLEKVIKKTTETRNDRMVDAIWNSNMTEDMKKEVMASLIR